MGVKVLAAVVVAALLGVGGWLILSEGPGDDWVRILLTVGFFFLVSFGIARLADARPELKTPLRVTFLVIAIGAGGFYVWDTWLRSKSEKTEKVERASVTASQVREEQKEATPPKEQNVQFSEGSFDGLAGHSATGTVTVVELSGDRGRRLVFDDFEVTKGPDLRVYAVEGGGGVSGDNFKDLGALEAEKGRFQYEIDDLDTRKYETIVIWCRAFSTPFGKATLERS